MSEIHEGRGESVSFDGQPSRTRASFSSPVPQSANPGLRFQTPSNTKQKRRRTSPRDHGILEAAYLTNSKPDKQERANIVNQVELGEKEVQIWFQNRRQNDRRKSKPLLPHELLPLLRNTGPGQLTSHLVTPSNSQDLLGFGVHSDVESSPETLPQPSSRSTAIHDLLNPLATVDSSSPPKEPASISRNDATLSTPPSSFEGVSQPTGGAPSSDPQSVRSRETDVRSDRLAKKRSHEEMADATKKQDIDSTAMDATVLGRTLRPSSSFLRLAMTAEGAVKVKTNGETTPSPPKPRAPPPSNYSRRDSSLLRSQSATEGSLGFKDINPPMRRAPGRSRDARTWEFYCDKGARDALASHAEDERSGSAVGAINLIRSASQRKTQALNLAPGRHNTRRSSGDSHGKPKIFRARSSMARLQSFDGATDLPSSKHKRARHVRSSSGDSDKENWAPGTRNSSNLLRRLQSTTARDTILQENDNGSGERTDLFRTGAADGATNSGNGSVREKSKGDDLDCVQGLLSLSQGAWR